MTKINQFRQVFAALMFILALAIGQNAWAQVSFDIQASYNSSTKKTTFTITRSGSSLPSQTIKFRTVNLSAYAGQHYTAVNGDFTFAANATSTTVEVSEGMASTDAYKYQTSTERSYRFEVLDVNGFQLAYYDRTMTYGLTQFSNAKVSKEITDLVYFNGTSYASGLNSSKYLDVSFTPPSGWVETSGTLSGYVLIDDSYDYANKPAQVSTSSLINSTGATASYLKSIGYEIYATVCFTEKERDDGYELALDNEYIMSPKDLCTLPFLDKVLDAGVEVLKIEGRGRSPEYTKMTVEVYHEAVKAIQEGTFTQDKIDAWMERLKSVYNRGFWDGYYLGRRTFEWSKQYGSQATQTKEFIGTVTNYFSKIGVAEIRVETHDLNVDDPIMIIGPTTGVYEDSIREIRLDDGPVPRAVKGDICSLPVKSVVRRGDKVYKIISA